MHDHQYGYGSEAATKLLSLLLLLLLLRLATIAAATAASDMINCIYPFRVYS